MPLPKRCDKTSRDPARHRGPFKHLKTFESGAQKIFAEKCEACGNTVLRELPKETGSSPSGRQ